MKEAVSAYADEKIRIKPGNEGLFTYMGPMEIRGPEIGDTKNSNTIETLDNLKRALLIRSKNL